MKKRILALLLTVIMILSNSSFIMAMDEEADVQEATIYEEPELFDDEIDVIDNIFDESTTEIFEEEQVMDAIDESFEDVMIDDFVCENTLESAEDEMLLQDNVIASGNCGITSTWILTEDGTLTISGTGEIIIGYFDCGTGEIINGWNNYRNSIEKIIIEKGVTTIGYESFIDCVNLKSVEIPDSVIDIGDYAFDNCSSLREIDLPSELAYIGEYAFGGCSNLTNIILPNKLKTIGYGAFQGCDSLKTIDLLSVLVSIEEWAFSRCSSLTEINLPNGLTSIGDLAFYDCDALLTINLPSSLKVIGAEAFADCNSLTEINLPSGLTAIGECAFENCSNLKEIIFTGSAPLIHESVFYDVIGTAYYPVNNTTWTEKVRQQYGGTIKWVPWDFSTGKPSEIRDINKTIIRLSKTSVKYTGKAITPSVTIKYGTTVLKKNIDYTVTYSNNVYVGTATVTVIGKGKYEGSTKKTFKIISPGKVTVKLEANGGKVSKKSLSLAKGAGYGNLPKPTMKGYAFIGWYTAKTGGKLIDKSSHVTKAITLYAHWKKVKYKITYNLNGGKNSNKNPEIYTYTSTKIKLASPKKKGYEFAGWYSDSKYKTKVTVIEKGSTGNKTFYAKWIPYTFKIYFDGNLPRKKATMTPMTIKYGMCYNLKKNTYKPGISGYEFAGWSFTKKGGLVFNDKASISIKQLVDEYGIKLSNGTEVKLYAKWRLKKYKIVYDSNGGTMPTGYKETFNIKEEVKPLPTPQRKGYTFAGWYSGSTKISYIKKGTSKNQNLKAKWKPITYTIHFDGNGYLQSVPADIKCTYDVNKQLPVIENDAFGRWSTVPDGNGTIIENGAIVNNLSAENGSTITLYAQPANTKIYVHPYSTLVQKGHIRYVYQSGDYKENGWGKYESKVGTRTDGDPTRECGFATQSMALSYLGIDISPEWLCDKVSTYYTTYCYGIDGIEAPDSGLMEGNNAYTTMQSMLDNFVKDGNRGFYSPVIVHYHNGSNLHTILVVGRNNDGTFIVVDTAKKDEILSLNISSNGYISGTQSSSAVHGGGVIDAVQQYKTK